MASFVLVHGGSHGAWCWERLIPHLRPDPRIESVVAVDLTGHGARRDVAALEARTRAAGSHQTVSAGGFPVVMFRPGIFMDNLATPFMKPMFVNEGVYRYPHTLDAAYDWICHEDLAKFMVAALQRPDLVGRKIHLGGPERLTTAQVIAILSEAIGRPLRHEYITSRKLGEDLYDLTVAGQGTGGVLEGVTRDEYAADLEAFYDFVDGSPLKPLQADMKKVLALIPAAYCVETD